jgi:hypothetical protein
MFNTRAVVVRFVAVLFAGSARAALPIEFEFRGVYTQTTGTVYLVGDPFTTTVRFDPAAADTDPSPQFGRYPYLSWSVPAPTGQTVTFTNPPVSFGDIKVNLLESGDQWRLSFDGTVAYGLNVFFPPGTFPTDALPTDLPPLSQTI